MTATLAAVRRFAACSPRRPAIRSATKALGYGELEERAAAIAAALEAREIEVLALAADNGPFWLAVDLAAQMVGSVVVAIPPYFSSEQVAHALEDSGADALLADARTYGRNAHGGCAATPLPGADGELVWTSLRPTRSVAMPAHTAKISYTSGTTGKPKGVCLTRIGLDAVGASLRDALGELDITRHLCVLPLATLLENVAGVYAPLMNGAEIVVPSAPETGLFGATRFDPNVLLACLGRYRPESIILVPQLLAQLVAALEQGAPQPTSLKLVAVGGGHVSAALLERANAVGLPVYEGYGLTECASVVTLNTPAARRVGSVGKPLAHASISVDADGEIHVAGPAVGGYVGSDVVPPSFATGDLGHLDAEGFLHIDGRRKSVFITSFGRNVSPEWVETELCAAGPIAQAAVFGEARPWNVAVIVPAAAATREGIDAAVASANCRLPDYARVSDWVLAKEPFTPANGELTQNGRNRRAAIWLRYRERIAELYDGTLDLTG